MKTFQDNQNRTWAITLNVDALKRIKDLTGVDLMQIVSDGGKLIERLVSDPVLLCDVIYAACREEAETKQISDRDFGRAMAGDAIEKATEALLGELADFFPQRRRAVLTKVLEKLARYQGKALELAEARLDDPAMDERITRAIEAAFKLLPLPTDGGSSGAAPASSD